MSGCLVSVRVCLDCGGGVVKIRAEKEGQICRWKDLAGRVCGGGHGPTHPLFAGVEFSVFICVSWVGLSWAIGMEVRGWLVG